MTQHRQHHQDQHLHHLEQQQQQQQQQVFPAVYDEVALSRIPASLHHALPAQVKPDAAPLEEEDDLLYYTTYEDDYGDHRAKRWVVRWVDGWVDRWVDG